MKILVYIFYWIIVISYYSVILSMIGDEVLEKNRWLKPVLWFIATFIIVSSIGIGVYYWFSHQYPSSLGLTTETGTVYWNRTDIIYLLTLIATLIAPVVLIWSLNGWKEQHNINIRKDIAMKLYSDSSNCYKNIKVIEAELQEIHELSAITLIKDERIEYLRGEIASLNSNKIEIETSRSACNFTGITSHNELNIIVDDYQREIANFLKMAKNYYDDLNSKVQMYDFYNKMAGNTDQPVEIRGNFYSKAREMEGKPIREVLSFGDNCIVGLSNIIKRAEIHKAELEDLIKPKILIK